MYIIHRRVHLWFAHNYPRNKSPTITCLCVCIVCEVLEGHVCGLLGAECYQLVLALSPQLKSMFFAFTATYILFRESRG